MFAPHRAAAPAAATMLTVVALAATSAPASAASCPNFSTGGKSVSAFTASGVSCATAKTDLKKALAARRSRSSWKCAGFAWTAAGNKVTGKSGSKRIVATVR